MTIRSALAWLLVISSALHAATPAADSGSAAPAEAESAMFRYSASHRATLSSRPAIDVGGLAWRFATGGTIRSTPAVSGGIAVFGSSDGWLYAVEVTSGVEKWKMRIGGEVSCSPAIVGQRVIVLGADGVLRALQLANGKPEWTLATGPDLSLGDDPRAFDLWVSSPTVVDGTIFIGGGDGKVYAVELATGHVRWEHVTKHRVRSTPAVVDDSVYVGSFDGCVYALDASTGAERWSYQTGDVVQSSPAVSDGRVFVGTRATAVLALDAKTGALLWRRPHSGSWVLASAAVAEGKVIIGGSDSHLLEALDEKTGAVVWSIPVGARMLGSPTVVDRTVLYGAEDFRVYSADLATGLGRSIEFTEGALYSSVVVAGDLLLVGSDDRHLYAFRTHAAAPAAAAVPLPLLRAAEGRYVTESGQEFTLSLHQGALAVTYCTYPTAEVRMQADGTFAWPMLWGTTGRLVRAEGQPASALALSLFGQEGIAKRCP